MKQLAGRPQMRNDWELERVFREGGPFFHLRTKPLETGIVFESDADRTAALGHVAIAAKTVGVDLLAYALPCDRFLFILQGSEGKCRAFFGLVKERLSVYFSRQGRPRVLDAVGEPELTPIATFRQMQDELVEVIRNPYVVRADVNPLACPWCSGFLYFNPLLDLAGARPASRPTHRARRRLRLSRNVKIPDGLTWVDGCVFPGSFVNYRLAESLFRNARQFTLLVFKDGVSVS